jgi:hypothetical protein
MYEALSGVWVLGLVLWLWFTTDLYTEADNDEDRQAAVGFGLVVTALILFTRYAP